MNFLYPEWFYALCLIPVILVTAMFVRSRRSESWKKLVGERHQQKLVTKSSSFKHWISFSCSLIALIGFIIAMTRPYQGKTEVRDKVQTRNVIIAIDCSLSMLCEDGDSAGTDRLSTAKIVANKLIDALPNEHIGVMAFAGSANMISSITIDHLSVKTAINQIDHNSAHTPGSNFTESVEKGIHSLKRAGKHSNALIFISDGTEEKIDIPSLAQEAKEASVQIFSVGIGSTYGGIIPINQGNDTTIAHRDQYGREVVTKLNDDPLRQLAAATSGKYSHASKADQMIATAVNNMDQFEQEGRSREVPHEY